MASKTFCVLPWVHAATLTNGDVQLCCVSGGGSGVNLNEHSLADYWQSEYVRDARRRMLAGERLPACVRCYREEALGRRSHRIHENERWDTRLGEDGVRRLVDRTADDGSLDAPIQYLDLRLGNTCNMQCVMCQPRESSRWLPVAKKLARACADPVLTSEWTYKSGIERGSFAWAQDPEFWSSLETLLPDIRTLIVAGGEPFLIRAQSEFVKACAETGHAGHIELRYHTNGSIFPEALVRHWEAFESVHFMVSIDGLGETADYVRHPSDWAAIDANVRRFDALGEHTRTTIHTTVHALNVYRLPELLEWARGLRNREYHDYLTGLVKVGLVHDPEYQRIDVLPADYKRAVGERIADYIRGTLPGEDVTEVTGAVDFMNAEDRSRDMPRLLEYTAQLDAIRGTDVLETFPELREPWARCAQTPAA